MPNPTNLPNTTAESTNNYFGQNFVKQGFVTDNQYEALVGLLQKRTINRASAENLAGAVIQGSAQQDTPFSEVFDLIKKSEGQEIDAFLAFFLNNTRVGTSYLGIKNLGAINPYITRTILV
jgi:uncharacterized protein YaiE (UPF0345 family)